jgi:prepilin-type N-terminal cleavage/methylation domain-containing protein
MKKNGFSIIELIISITLLSIVLIFMLNLLISLGSKRRNLTRFLDLDVDTSLISMTLNKDINNLSGIKYIECPSVTKCEITFNKDLEIKTLEILSDSKTIKYGNNKKNDLTKKLSQNYTFGHLELTNEYLTNGTFFKIVIPINDNPKYNVEIYSYLLK